MSDNLEAFRQCYLEYPHLISETASRDFNLPAISETNPIPVNGSIGQLAYLSKLETERGERILFHRIGAVDTIDVFEAVTFSGSEWFILFVDLYHPRRSRLTPDGFRFTQEVGQFS
ncbi:MAG: hypothetical protein OXE42_20765, partial [Gammaproteobacteria bacterium]|nr:hypothetical protein [Gammaproteobacteria bacterium]